VAHIVRPLLVQGNEKLSEGVWHFDLPAIRTCPGRSNRCSASCYATRRRYKFPQVQERLEWNFQQSKRSDFADRLVTELYRKGVILMRWHCAGDVYSPAYARKVLDVIGRSRHTTFWGYTRSYRVPSIFPILQAMSCLPNMHLWFSADAETGYPPFVPPRVRVAWMQTELGEATDDADLVFLDNAVQRQIVSLPVIANTCPTDTPEGKALGVTCATCGTCWHEAQTS
jgi:hypothetical protein